MLRARSSRHCIPRPSTTTLALAGQWPIQQIRKQSPCITRSIHASLNPDETSEVYEADPRQDGWSDVSLIDFVVPRSRFGNSIFGTTSLLFLRLFYQAKGFDPLTTPVGSSIGLSGLSRRTEAPGSSTVCGPDVLEDITARTRAESWQSCLSDSRHPIDETFSVTSLTWVKSLSAPASHEFIHFILASPNSDTSFRIVAERDTHGDWVFIDAASSIVTGQGHDQSANHCMKHIRPRDEQHDLPLPLLSLSWKHLSHSQRPTALQLSTILKNTTQRCPEYRLVREHCWWYAEAIFDAMLSFSNQKTDRTRRGDTKGEAKLVQWPWALYRYSYVVVGKKYLKRDALIREAIEFRREMDRDGVLRW